MLLSQVKPQVVRLRLILHGGVVSNRDPMRAARHLAYELGVLRTSFNAFTPGHPISVLHLECFLLHARNLLEFFFDGAVKRAILPRDFGASGARDKDAAMASLRDEISQLVSHLTWDRVTLHEPKTQDWSYERLSSIFESIREKAIQFFHEIPSSNHGWFATEEYPNEPDYWSD